MTAEKAITFLKETIAGCHILRDKQLKAVCEISIKALEKQIPKKPIVKDDTAFDGSLIDVLLCCPVCNRKICSEPADYIMASFLKEEYPHCHCGQALDWSDTE